MTSRIGPRVRSALSLFLLFVSFYALTNAGDSKWGDETYMIMVARNIVSEGRIGFNEEEITSILYWDHFAARGPSGQYYMKWGLGQSLVEVPFLLIHRAAWVLFAPAGVEAPKTSAYHSSEFVCLMLCPAVLSAVGCLVFFGMSLRLGYSRKVSLWLTLLYGVCTMTWPYSKSFMSETTLNVAVLGGVYGAMQYTAKRQWPWMVLSGACMGFAVVTKVTSLVLVPLVLVYVAATVRTKKSLLNLLRFFVPPLCAFLALQAWHNGIRYGSVWEWGYRAGSDALGFCTPLGVGLWGLLGSPGKSFFLYAPVAVLGVLFFGSFMRERKAEALLGLSICVLFTLLHARWWSWAGDWAWGPRFLLVITPYVLLPCGVLLERWSRLGRLRRILVLAVILFSLGIQILGVAVHPFSYIQVRGSVLDQLVVPEMDVLSSRKWSTESALAHFTPVFSHVSGNWWLFKHMVFSYDLWSDPPWQSLGHFDVEPPMWVIGDRAVPFWWPVALPMFYQGTEKWVYALAVANFLMLIWGAVRLRRWILEEET